MGPISYGVAARCSRLGLAVALAFVVLRALPNLTYPMGNDQATYGLIGDALLHGQKLYRDVWDMKPPGIFWTYAVMVKLFGTVMWSVGVADILWLLAISWCIFRFAERDLGTAVAVIAVVVHAMWHCRAGALYAAQPENFLTLLVLAAYVLVKREGRRWLGRQFLAGLLLGAAFWMKYNAVALLPFVLLAPWLDRDQLDARPLRLRLALPWRTWLAGASMVVLGAMAVVMAGLAYFWRAGLWSAFAHDHFEVASRYGSFPLRHWPGYWMLPPSATVLHLGAPTLAATVAAFILAYRRHDLSKLGPAALGAFFGYASVAMQIRFPPFGFEACYPFFAVFWAYLIVRTFESRRLLDREHVWSGEPWARGLLRAIMACAMAVLAVAEGWSTARGYRQIAAWSRDQDAFYTNYPVELRFEHFRDKMQVIHYLGQHHSPGDGLYIWGIPCLVYYLTGARPPTRFVVNYPLISPWGPPAWREELLRDLKRSPPAFIVVARRDEAPLNTLTPLDSEQYLKLFPALDAFISSLYRKVADFRDFVIYQRAPAR